MTMVEHGGKMWPDPGPGMHYEDPPDAPHARISRNPVPKPDPDPRPVADHDMLIVREDLGPNMHTFVAAGDPIPLELTDYERVPAPVDEPTAPAG